MSRRRRPASPPAAALEDDNLLWKILLLLPPQPSSLPRVSAVCKRWRRLVTDPQFLRRFRARHREPPLLGLVMGYTGDPFFRSTLDAPDLIPNERFFPRDLYGVQTDLFGCRHGRILFFHRTRHEVVVWDPATRDRRCVAVPPEFDDKERIVFNGAVLCAAAGDDGGHVHGDCHSSPFQVVLIGIHEDCTRTFASVYSSESGTWGDLISTAAIRHMYDMTNPSTLTGDSLYWLFDDYEDGILKFDLDRQSLANIEMPDLRYYSYSSSSWIMPAEDGGIGLAILSRYDFEMWERKVTCDGVAGWVLQKTIKLNTVLGLGPMGGGDNLILGYDEDDHVIYIRTEIGVCMVQLVSMQFRNLGKDNFTTTAYHPYKSFYSAVHDLAISKRRVDGISRPLAKDSSGSAAASRGAGAARGDAAASSSGTGPERGAFGKSKLIVQQMDADLVPSRVLTQTRIDVIFKKEMETRSKITKAWAKWFRNNSVPGSKADCPHFHSAMNLTQQLGTRLPVPTGEEIDGANVDANEEELP